MFLKEIFYNVYRTYLFFRISIFKNYPKQKCTTLSTQLPHKDMISLEVQIAIPTTFKGMQKQLRIMIHVPFFFPVDLNVENLFKIDWCDIILHITLPDANHSNPVYYEGWLDLRENEIPYRVIERVPHINIYKRKSILKNINEIFIYTWF